MMFPHAWIVWHLLLSVPAVLCSLDIVENSGGVTCSQALSGCSLHDVIPLDFPPSSVRVTALRPQVKLCCTDTCELCLWISVELEVDQPVEEEDNSGLADDEGTEETKDNEADSVTVCYKTPEVLPMCKKVEFTVNKARASQQSKAQISMIITNAVITYESEVSIYLPNVPELDKEVIVPSLTEVCSSDINTHVQECKAPPSPTQRFLLRPASLSLPLCFDLPTNVKVKLLHHPSRDLDVTGDLGPEENGGFRNIVINVQSGLSIVVDTAGVTVKEGQTSNHYSGENQVTAGRATVIIRNKEVDVSIGDVRLVTLVHEVSGRKFLWPVFRQLPLDDRAEGVLVANMIFEKEKESAGKVKLNGQVFLYRRSIATDYSVNTALRVDCLHMSAQDAFQRPSTDLYT